ncbi:dehydrogenase/reductase SDR family member 7B isoform X1 [Monodon monoceros]|uniref:dehydrogenase/reductase SDR family member 7B isoform X1 n=1 Tax=Monodon monoceros TaxID=40151 RepID=UPI0010F5CA20|nr:dehydrogenase/reductase SDR family member 7B isoform X1 [Monodon monoceros]
MDFITSTATLPLLLGCVGVFSLCKLLQWLRTRAYVRNAVVVITGATSGLGRECARVFHAAGAKLVLCGRNAEALEELTRELAASRATEVQTHKPYTVTFDLTDPGAIVGAAAEILQCFGYVDVLINNAGISYRGTIVDTSLDVDKRVMETNYFGPVALTKALLPSMIRRRQGHVVAISSIQGKISVPFRSACEYFLLLPTFPLLFSPCYENNTFTVQNSDVRETLSTERAGPSSACAPEQRPGLSPSSAPRATCGPRAVPPECRPLSVPPPSAHRCCPTATLPHVPPEFFYMGSDVQSWGALCVVLWPAYSTGPCLSVLAHMDVPGPFKWVYSH